MRHCPGRALLHLRPCVSAEHHIGVRSNCPLWTMCMNSIPIRTRRALENLLTPSIGWQRELIRPRVLVVHVVQVLTAADPDWVLPTEIEFIAHSHAAQRGVRRLETVKRDGTGLTMALQRLAEEGFG